MRKFQYSNSKRNILLSFQLDPESQNLTPCLIILPEVFKLLWFRKDIELVPDTPLSASAVMKGYDYGANEIC